MKRDETWNELILTQRSSRDSVSPATSNDSTHSEPDGGDFGVKLYCWACWVSTPPNRGVCYLYWLPLPPSNTNRLPLSVRSSVSYPPPSCSLSPSFFSFYSLFSLPLAFPLFSTERNGKKRGWYWKEGRLFSSTLLPSSDHGIMRLEAKNRGASVDGRWPA